MTEIRIIFILLMCLIWSCTQKVVEEGCLLLASLELSETVLEADGSDSTFCIVSGLVRGSDGQPAAGVEVHYSVDLGEISAIGITDSSGIAKAVYQETGIAGEAKIRAWLTGAEEEGLEATVQVIPFLPAEAGSIVFCEEEMIELQVPAGELAHSVWIEAGVYDICGELLEGCQEVWFGFTERPEGTNLNAQVYGLEDSLCVLSQDGIAAVCVNSGREAGSISLQAWLINSNGQKISATSSNIVVVPGFPEQGMISYSGWNSGLEQGDGLWQTKIRFQIYDVFGNFVEDGYEVEFQIIEPVDYAQLGSEHCQVGNEDMQGNSYAGTAFTTLVWDGAYTNERVRISGRVWPWFDLEQDIELMLQYGELQMICVPANLEWTEAGDETERRTQCRVSLRDGQQNPVNNELLVFGSDFGEPTDEDIHPVLSDITDPVIQELYNWGNLNGDGCAEDGYTGWYEGEMGYLAKYVIFEKSDCASPGEALPGMRECEITVEQPWADLSVSGGVTLVRYVD